MVKNHFNADAVSAVSDPTDFPPLTTAPGLRQLDNALRCNICRELFEGPVTLPCGHCFCSICIRSALSIKQECPSCLKVANEGHLRINPALEEAVTSWQVARPYVLELSKANEPRVAPSPDFREVHTPERMGQSAKKRKRGAHVGEIIPETPPSMTAGPSRVRDRYGSPRLDLNEKGEGDFGDPVPSSDPGEEEVTDKTFVNCPVCDKKVKLERINTHIDKGCQPSSPKALPSNESRSKKSEWADLFGGTKKDGRNKGKEKFTSPTPDPLPKVAYKVLKDRQLKELLTVHKLPALGDRPSLISRHQRWVTIYNANLDRSKSHRKSQQELRVDLKKWEEDRKGKKSTVNDLEAHQKTHRTEFAKLVEAARPKENTGVVLSSPVRTPERRVEHDVLVLDSEEEGDI